MNYIYSDTIYLLLVYLLGESELIIDWFILQMWLLLSRGWLL